MTGSVEGSVHCSIGPIFHLLVCQCVNPSVGCTMWNFENFGFKMKNLYIYSYVLKISSLRNKASLRKDKLIFEMHLNHCELQSAFSTLDPIVA